MSSSVLVELISPLVLFIIGLMLRFSNYLGWGKRAGTYLMVIGLIIIALKIGDYLITR
jgi:hypothetical protein